MGTLQNQSESSQHIIPKSLLMDIGIRIGYKFSTITTGLFAFVGLDICV
jgi:hypothetical protein